MRRDYPDFSFTRDDFTSGSLWEKIPCGSHFWGNFNLGTCAMHGDKLWARFGKTQLMALHRGKVLEFLSTPYGLVAIGEGTVGLIEVVGNED